MNTKTPSWVETENRNNQEKRQVTKDLKALITRAIDMDEFELAKGLITVLGDHNKD